MGPFLRKLITIAIFFLLVGCQTTQYLSHPPPKYDGIVSALKEPVLLRINPHPKAVFATETEAEMLFNKQVFLFNIRSHGSLEVESNNSDRVINKHYELIESRFDIDASGNSKISNYNNPYRTQTTVSPLNHIISVDAKIFVTNKNFKTTKESVAKGERASRIKFSEKEISTGHVVTNQIILTGEAISLNWVLTGETIYRGRKSLHLTTEHKDTDNTVIGYNLIDIKTGAVVLSDVQVISSGTADYFGKAYSRTHTRSSLELPAN